MARKKDRKKAIALRLAGKSYSEIRNILGISKSTLSNWLHSYPLSEQRIRELRDKNPRRIERFKNTMRRKRDVRINAVYEKVALDIGTLSDRELFIAGLFLYWAEGSKTSAYTTALANTDPAMIRFFIKWLDVLGIHQDKIVIRLHLYSDMDVAKIEQFWSQEIGVSLQRFRKSYIKKTIYQKTKNYRGRFGYGTCNVLLYNRDVAEYVAQGVRHIQGIAPVA